MKHTFRTSNGARIVVEPSATGRSVQVTVFDADRPTQGFLIPRELSGVVAQAIQLEGCRLESQHAELLAAVRAQVDAA